MRVIFLRSGLVILGDNLVATRAAKNCWNYRGAKWDEGNIDYTTVIYLWLYIQVVYTIHIPCWFFSLKSQSWTSPVMLVTPVRSSSSPFCIRIQGARDLFLRPVLVVVRCLNEIHGWTFWRLQEEKWPRLIDYPIVVLSCHEVFHGFHGHDWFNFKWHLLGFIPSPPRNLRKASIRDPGGDVRKPSFAHGTWDYQVSGFLTVSPKKGMRAMGCGSSKGFKVKLVKLGIWTRVSTAPPPRINRAPFCTRWGHYEGRRELLDLVQQLTRLEPHNTETQFTSFTWNFERFRGMRCDALWQFAWFILKKTGNVGNLIHEELSLCRRCVLDMTMWWVANLQVERTALRIRRCSSNTCLFFNRQIWSRQSGTWKPYL